MTYIAYIIYMSYVTYVTHITYMIYINYSLIICVGYKNAYYMKSWCKKVNF